MSETPQPKNPLREIVQPFIDLVHAPRALWGINLAYVIEGMVYFGMLGYLSIYVPGYIFQAIDGADEAAHYMIMALTAGITIAMFFLGVVADKRGVRFALITAFVFMLIGRALWSGAPNLFGLEPVRPGVFPGDRVDLHVTKLETRNGVRAISDATLLAIQPQALEPARELALELAAGEGISPGPELQSRLVALSKAKVVAGDGTLWEIEYGSAPVRARLFAHSAEAVGLCPGAVISLNQAYIFGEAAPVHAQHDWDYVIRQNWPEDFALVDNSGCSEPPERGESQQAVPDSDLRPRKRWRPATPSAQAQQAREVDLVELRALPDGPVNVILRGVYVTYVRNGGYFVQADADGPAMFVFVSPFGSGLQILTLVGMLLVVIGYGMYQPAAYAGVRKFTTPKTAAMGFAMLYALMNLGGWLPSFAFLLRDKDYLGLGIQGTFWVYTGFTAIALLATILILTRRTVEEATARAAEETARIRAAEQQAAGDGNAEQQPQPTPGAPAPLEPQRIKLHMWLFWLAGIGLLLFKGEPPWFYGWREFLEGWERSGLLSGVVWRWILAGLIFICPAFFAAIPRARRWLAAHPLENGKFAYFIFCLIPVQTLFTYNWLVLPAYINRAYAGWIGEKFELAANLNPILIFVLVPIIAAATQRAKVYNMMIYGTFVMAAPAFLLALGPHWWTLFPYIIIMTIGEAMWQPRFLQYAAEIAPEGRTGEYMGVAQLPWFLTKVLVPLLYSGRMMDRYCPAEGPQNTEVMWFIFGCIAISSTILLLLAKGWIGRDFKTRHEAP